MYVSPAKALRMYQVSKPTLYADMKSGKLSYKVNDRKKRKINVAELDRLYDKKEAEEGIVNSENVKSKSTLTKSNVSKNSLEKEVAKLREKIAESRNREFETLKNQIEQQQEQIEQLNQNLNKALDITALLEDKREGQGAKEAERDTKMELLENQFKRLTAQTERQAAIDEKRKKRIEELEQEKSKGFFKRLFG